MPKDKINFTAWWWIQTGDEVLYLPETFRLSSVYYWRRNLLRKHWPTISVHSFWMEKHSQRPRKFCGTSAHMCLVRVLIPVRLVGSLWKPDSIQTYVFIVILPANGCARSSPRCMWMLAPNRCRLASERKSLPSQTWKRNTFPCCSLHAYMASFLPIIMHFLGCANDRFLH